MNILPHTFQTRLALHPFICTSKLKNVFRTSDHPKGVVHKTCGHEWSRGRVRQKSILLNIHSKILCKGKGDGVIITLKRTTLFIDDPGWNKMWWIKKIEIKMIIWFLFSNFLIVIYKFEYCDKIAYSKKILLFCLFCLNYLQYLRKWKYFWAFL